MIVVHLKQSLYRVSVCRGQCAFPSMSFLSRFTWVASRPNSSILSSDMNEWSGIVRRTFIHQLRLPVDFSIQLLTNNISWISRKRESQLKRRSSSLESFVKELASSFLSFVVFVYIHTYVSLFLYCRSLTNLTTESGTDHPEKLVRKTSIRRIQNGQNVIIDVVLERGTNSSYRVRSSLRSVLSLWCK